MPTPQISIIVPFFGHRIEGLLKCLDCLLDQCEGTPDYEILVIDNNPSPGLCSQIPSHSLVTCVHHQRPGSYSARNAGIRLSKGDIIGFTDSDCLPSSDWILKGYEAIKSNNNCGFVAGQIQMTFLNPNVPNAYEIYDCCVHMRQKTYVENLHFGATANLFVRKEVFEKVGVFNEAFFSGGDREFGQRVYEAGLQQIYSEEVKIKHPCRSTISELTPKIRRLVGQEHTILKNANQSSWRLRLCYIEFKRTAPRIRMITASANRFGNKSIRKALVVLLRVQIIRYLEVVRLCCGSKPLR